MHVGILVPEYHVHYLPVLEVAADSVLQVFLVSLGLRNGVSL